MPLAMATSNFKVIIVGGGPVGLFAALAFSSVGIDFVLLEQRENITIDVGACLAVTPATLRVFHQLGLLDQLLSIGSKLETRQTFTLHGHLFDSNAFQYMEKNHGTTLHVFHRAELVKFLYDSLGDKKAKVITGKNAVDIVTNDDGVTVTCADGSIYKGSILLGADGVHSKTRRLMRELALKSTPDVEWDPEMPYTSTYKCMFFSIPRTSTPGLFVDTENKDSSVFYATGNERAWVFLNEKMAQPTVERTNYTIKDSELFAEKFLEYPITKSLKMKDVFSRRTSSGMANLEEGLVKNWSWGRIVLAGDSCHKFTPHAGLGFNNGIQDIVVLVNELRRATAAADGRLLKSSEIAAAFQSYQASREEPVRVDALVSATVARSQTWANTWYYILGRYIAPLWLWEYLLWNYIAPQGMKMTPIFEDMPAEEPFLGAIEWDNKMKAPAE